MAGGALGLAVAMGGLAIHAVGHSMMHSGHGSHEGGPGHDHAEAAPPATYAEAVARVRGLIEKMEASLAKGAVDPGLHEDAHQVDDLGRVLGRLALKADSGVAARDVKGINLAGKALARAADELHEAADAGKPAAELTPLLAKVKAAASGIGVPGDNDWVCEMHCEGEKVYARAGACPVCGMALSRVSETPWGVIVTADAAVLPGKPADLTIKLTDPRGRPVSALETVHEHPLHAVIVSGDLSFFAHEHPEPVAGKPGEFTLKGLTLPAGGRYAIFADFTPAGRASVQGKGGRQPRFEFKVPGEPPATAALVEDYDKIDKVGPYEVRVRCNGDRFYAGRDSFLRYGIDLNGKPVIDLEPLMGERGHLIAVSADLETYIHAHPLDFSVSPSAVPTGPHAGHDHADAALVAKAREVMFGNGTPSDTVYHAVFPRPGLYKVFVQFKHAGKVWTSSVVVDAQPGGEGPGAAPAATHDHAGHGAKGGSAR
jgi:hypothetical protein